MDLQRRADGYETIMMNSNPETVSTDYDTSSRLYFEPLTIEDVLNVIEKERPEGIIIQFGGQTPLKLANAIQKFLEDNPLKASSGEQTTHYRSPLSSSSSALACLHWGTHHKSDRALAMMHLCADVALDWHIWVHI